MPTRVYIVDEIRRIAEKNGTPPGRLVFEKETGIRQPEWYGVHWRSWGDALKEAGDEPNLKNAKFASDDVLRKYAEAVRHFGRIPAEIDVRMYSRERPDFPSHSTFANHFGNKAGRITALAEWVAENAEFADIVELIPAVTQEAQRGSFSPENEGFVYLLKSGDHYKIGRSDALERRVKQIAVALPEELTLEHAIRTDDPPGIEAYRHRRFADRRANGEWFRLTPSDLRAFKKRRFQ